MDRYVEVLCKQNPITTMECGNPECKHEFKVKSVEFFKNGKYSHTCEKCEKSTEYDTTKFAKEFKEQFKKLGITLK